MMDLKKVLENHLDWLNNNGGERADLRSADLSYANLRSADLSYADLRSANLRSADLRSANLRSADLSYANLSYADLSYANLRSANLRSAKLSSPTILLLANWGDVNDNLCAELMNFDAHNCPDGKKLFTNWVKNGICPYFCLKIQRCANFTEKKELFVYKKTVKSAFELMKLLIIEKCKDSDYHGEVK